MTKRRSRSNRIGARGEAAFLLFATERGLLPTKAQEDVGLDFVCQVDSNPASSGLSEITGGIVGFAVRATESSDRRVRLSRNDAHLLLRMDVPVGVVLVDGPATATSFHHRMVDEAFASELAAFLDSDRQSLSLTPMHCRGERDFRADVHAALRPGEIERRRLALAEGRLRQKLGSVRIGVQRNADGATTFVTRFRFWDIFRDLAAEERELLHLATFGAPQLLPRRLELLAVSEDLVVELEGLPQPYILGGELEYRESALRAEGPNGVATCRFLATRNGAHYGHVHDAGFALTVSERQEHEGQWVHWLQGLADPDVALDLDDHPDLWGFLSASVPGATITDVDRPTWRFEVEAFAGLWRLGAFAACMKDSRSLPGWSSHIAQLRDADDEETMHCVQWLAMVARDLKRVPKIRFAIEADEGVGDERRPGRWRVPVVANTCRASVVTWLACRGHLFLRDDVIVGIDTKEYLDARVEITDVRTTKATIFPEFVFDAKFPSIAIGETGLVRGSPTVGVEPAQFLLDSDDRQ